MYASLSSIFSPSCADRNSSSAPLPSVRAVTTSRLVSPPGESSSTDSRLDRVSSPTRTRRSVDSELHPDLEASPRRNSSSSGRAEKYRQELERLRTGEAPQVKKSGEAQERRRQRTKRDQNAGDTPAQATGGELRE